jgi:ADP-dependent NAD(P)H-hydrate dehydratase / NAD(P)H-hydrate epimerase
MQHDYWHRQVGDTPLFPNLLWSRPENRQHAGKLLIIGGNLHGFAAPAEAYQQSLQAGIGTARVVLPDALQRTVGRAFEAGEYAPSTPSGSFSQLALSEFLSMSQWADGVLVAGDLGRNSETAILLENFAEKYVGQLTITKDAADYFTTASQKVLTRPDTLFVISLAQLQKLAQSANFTHAFTFTMDLIRLVETLHTFTQTYQTSIIVKHLDNVLLAHHGQVSSTKLVRDEEVWRLPAATRAAVWWLQNPQQSFEALTTSQVMPKSAE